MDVSNDKIIFPSKFIELDDIIFKDSCISRSENLVVYKRNIVSDSFVYFTKKLTYKMITLSSCANRIIGYIGAFLEFNTNIIEFSWSKFSSYYKCNKITFINAIKELEDNDIIERYSGRYSVYGINYKYLFYGSIVNFIDRYRMEFGNEKPIFDNDNRIILSEDLYNQYKNNKKINNTINK